MMKNFIIRFKYFFFGFIFLIYWSATFLFTLPENYITVSLLPQAKLFEALFYQKWGFFAPPPKHNDRLYYSFIDEGRQNVKSYEVVQSLGKTKRERFPFNGGPDILEYIVGNSINLIHDAQYDFNSKYEAKVALDSSLQDRVSLDTLRRAVVMNTSSYQTLLNYGTIIKDKYKVNDKYKYMVMSFGRKTIPKFINRHEEGEELITFIGDTIEIDRIIANQKLIK